MTGRRFHLLPPGSPFGWTPYAWLIYLLTFLIEPVIRTQHGTAGVWYWTATVLAIAVFLAAYFVGFWVRDRGRYVVVAVLTALGLATAPFNTGASVFFVYAASFAGFIELQRTAVRLVLALAGLGGLTAWATGAPAYFWIVAIPITLLVGGVNVHYAAQSRANRRLRLAHEQIEHLAAVAERERIARDLHDVLGHTLSMIVLKAELAGKLIGRDPARAAAEIGDVESAARRTLQEVREAIRGYRPGLQDEARRAAALLEAAGVRAAVDVPVIELPPETEQALALALREAATNIVRHAAARTCTFRLRTDGNGCVLEVRDDGLGGAAVEGSGLRGMRERIEACGGRMELDGTRGLRLRIALPVPGAAAPPGAEATTA